MERKAWGEIDTLLATKKERKKKRVTNCLVWSLRNWKKDLFMDFLSLFHSFGFPPADWYSQQIQLIQIRVSSTFEDKTLINKGNIIPRVKTRDIWLKIKEYHSTTTLVGHLFHFILLILNFLDSHHVLGRWTKIK